MQCFRRSNLPKNKHKIWRVNSQWELFYKNESKNFKTHITKWVVWNAKIDDERPQGLTPACRLLSSVKRLFDNKLVLLDRKHQVIWNVISIKTSLIMCLTTHYPTWQKIRFEFKTLCVRVRRLVDIRMN